MYVVIGENAAYIIFLMFLGIVNDTSKDKKWSIGANESAAGQGKAIQCVIHLVWCIPNCRWRENLPLMTASLKARKMTLDSNPRINDLKSMG